MNIAPIIVFSMCFSGLLSECAETDNAIGMAIVSAAREQMGETLHYDPAYRTIAYPDGDVPIDRAFAPMS